MTHKHPDILATYELAYRDPSATVLEGLHAIKHAFRFGAQPRDLVTPDKAALIDLCDELAPDLRHLIDDGALQISASDFATLTRRTPATPILGTAKTRRRELKDIGPGITIVLYEPRHHGNAGAAIRVAAAAGATSVVFLGDLDPWEPGVVRAAAGLHYALDVFHGHALRDLRRPLIALDPDGSEEGLLALPANGTYLFGGERHGLPDSVLRDCDKVVRIPMRPGVSSLNLATSVAATLYSTSRIVF